VAPPLYGVQRHEGIGMGKNNRKRDNERRRAEQRRLAARRADGSTAYGSGPPPSIALLIQGAVQGRLTEDHRLYDASVDRLATVAAEGPATVSEALATEVSRRLRLCWQNGWQPVDVVSVVRRLESAVHADVMASAVVDDARHDAGQPMHPNWAAQLEDMQPWWSARGKSDGPWLLRLAGTLGFNMRDAIEHAVVLIARVQRFPPLPTLIPPPGPGAAMAAARRTLPSDAALDPKMLGRVRALLAKAESTEFPEEADSFTEKAQELMTRYSIDVAMVAATSGSAVGGPEGRRIHLDPPYIDAKASLVHAVASANRCKSVLLSEFGFITVFGFSTDLAVVDVLFTSLLAQATTAMVVAGRVVNQAGVSRTRSFRQSFLISFAHRIGERLQEAASTSTKEAEVTFGASLLPVLVQREADVDRAVAEAFPRMRQVRNRVSNAAGWNAGRVAADQASLQPGAELVR
jgi:Protein of unknown function (DUF2786)